MEKINTPLTICINRTMSKIGDLKRRIQTNKHLEQVQIYKRDLKMHEKELKFMKSLLTTEREVIEKAYIQACHDSQNFDMDLSDDSELEHYASDHFTQIFKSYE